jgi:hypothetical protein
MSTPYSWAWGGVGMTEAAGGRLSRGGRRWRTWGRGRQRREQMQTATVGARGGGQRGQRRGEQLWTAMADGRGKGGGGGGGRSWRRQPGEDGVRRNGNLGGDWLG